MRSSQPSQHSSPGQQIRWQTSSAVRVYSAPIARMSSFASRTCRGHFLNVADPARMAVTNPSSSTRGIAPHRSTSSPIVPAQNRPPRSHLPSLNTTAPTRSGSVRLRSAPPGHSSRCTRQPSMSYSACSRSSQTGPSPGMQGIWVAT